MPREKQVEALSHLCARTSWVDCIEHKCPLNDYCKAQKYPRPIVSWQDEIIEQAYDEMVRLGTIKEE